MKKGRASDKSGNPFDRFLAAVNLPADLPAAPTSQAGASPAAGVSSAPAAFSFFTESAPDAAPSPEEIGRDRTAPAELGASASAGAVLAVELSPAVALILSLVMTAKAIPANEAISRAICVFAESIGVPSLVTEIETLGAKRHGNRDAGDFHSVPEWPRARVSRFRGRR